MKTYTMDSVDEQLDFIRGSVATRRTVLWSRVYRLEFQRARFEFQRARIEFQRAAP